MIAWILRSERSFMDGLHGFLMSERINKGKERELQNWKLLIKKKKSESDAK